MDQTSSATLIWENTGFLNALLGVGWIPVDPTVGQRGRREKEYYFGNLDNKHQPHLKSVNMVFHTQSGHPGAGFSQVGEWRWYPAAGSTGDNMSVEFRKFGKKL